jgi:hypothetical protein
MKIIDHKSRLCNNCHKKITDFTKQEFSTPQKNVCGYFSLHQVHKIHRKLFHHQFSTLSLSLLSLLSIAISPQNLIAQNTIEKSESKNNFAGNIKIAGIIKDRLNNEPIPSVSVVAKHQENFVAGVVTDLHGKFSLTIDTSKNKLDQLQIIFSSVGYKQDTFQKINLSKELLNKEVTISLDAILHLPVIESIHYRTTGLIEIEPMQKESTPQKE